MVEVHVLTLPLSSVTVKVTVFAPTSVQSKSVSLSVIVAMPQLSEEPLSTWAAVMEPARGVKLNRQVLANRCGVDVVLTVLWKYTSRYLIPVVSVTVKVTVFAPTLVQSKLRLSQRHRGDATVVCRYRCST